MNTQLSVGNEWRDVLRTLDNQKLYEELGNVLDEHRLLALAKRRDALIGDD